MRVLLIVQPEREDFYQYLSCDDKSEYVLLWSEKAGQSQKRLPFIKHEFYWTDYATPIALIKSIKPDKIVLFEIIDQRQVALIVAANAIGVSTFYLEHGAAPDIDIELEIINPSLRFIKQRSSYVLKRFFFSLGFVLKTKFFYFSSLHFTNSITSFTKYILLPFYMQWNAPKKALLRIAFAERVPKYSLPFNEANFEVYKLFSGAKPESAHYTGIPMFDSYHQSRPDSPENGIIYIEHPFLESDFLGWNETHHKKVAETLFHFANETHTPLLVKLHPRSDLKRWKSYNLHSEYFEVVQQGNFTDRYLSAKLILSYSSSLIAGLLCAKKNIVLLGWHPEPRIFGADFSKTGLCHISMEMNELFTNIESWTDNNLVLQHPDLYNKFLKRNNYPFDGRAAERIVHAIRTL